jgi:phage-related protein
MSKQEEIKEKVYSFASQVKSKVEDLEVQLVLGKAEAEDWLEEEKKKFNDFIRSAKSAVEKAENIRKEKKEELITKCEELQVQLALGKAETREAFETQKSKIDVAMKNFQKGIQTVDDELSDIPGLLENAGSQLISKLEAFEVQFELARAESKDILEEMKKEFSNQINKLKNKLES